MHVHKKARESLMWKYHSLSVLEFTTAGNTDLSVLSKVVKSQVIPFLHMYLPFATCSNYCQII